MSDAFAGKTVIVTGASRGIGAATARWLLERGAQVVAASRSGSLPEGTEAGPKLQGFAADMGNEGAIRNLFAFCDETFGPVDILINNAAVIEVAPFADMESAAWRRMLDVNLIGLAAACREAFRRMEKRGGCIVNIGSLGGILKYEKFPGFSAYSASKAAVAVLSECLAVEGKPHGIRVHCLAPGAVNTQMLREAAPGLRSSTMPEDIAEAVGFLCDGARAAKLTGCVIDLPSNG